MTLSLPSGVALAALLEVARAGALTAAALTQRHGPPPAWQDLIDQGLLRPIKTPRGVVYVLSTKAHALLQGCGEPMDRVTAVTRAVDRSYQYDALAVLRAEGYRVVHAHPQGGPAGHGRFVRYTVEVPAVQMAELKDAWPTNSPPPSPGAPWRESLGRPSVYATCSGGGRGRLAVQTLVERVHHRDVDFRWRAPVVVFVPELTPDLRAYVRRHDGERTAALDRQFGVGRIHGRPRYADLDLRVLPLRTRDE